MFSKTAFLQSVCDATIDVIQNITFLCIAATSAEEVFVADGLFHTVQLLHGNVYTTYNFSTIVS